MSEMREVHGVAGVIRKRDEEHTLMVIDGFSRVKLSIDGWSVSLTLDQAIMISDMLKASVIRSRTPKEEQADV